MIIVVTRVVGVGRLVASLVFVLALITLRVVLLLTRTATIIVVALAVRLIVVRTTTFIVVLIALVVRLTTS